MSVTWYSEAIVLNFAEGKPCNPFTRSGIHLKQLSCGGKSGMLMALGGQCIMRCTSS